MPPPARRGKKQPTAPGPTAPAPKALTIRMLVGAHAGQLVRVTRDEATRLCSGWQPQAELVAVNRAETRETR